MIWRVQIFSRSSGMEATDESGQPSRIYVGIDQLYDVVSGLGEKNPDNDYVCTPKSAPAVASPLFKPPLE